MIYIYPCDCIETNVKINFIFYVRTGTYEKRVIKTALSLGYLETLANSNT